MRNAKYSNVRIGRFLPGEFTLHRGTWRDYKSLAPFHYVARHPRTYAQIWVVRYRDGPEGRRDAQRPTAARPVAVGVLSYPMPSGFARERYLDHPHFTRAQHLRFANRHIRTISRVIVHPQFRALGLSTLLVRTMCQRATTRYVEAFAAMGRVHPLFERAGMTRIELAGQPASPVYFIFDRSSKCN